MLEGRFCARLGPAVGMARKICGNLLLGGRRIYKPKGWPMLSVTVIDRL
jgi:hypothetical protein